MTQGIEVPDSDRPSEYRPASLTARVIAGKTILMPLGWLPGGLNGHLRKKGYKLRQHRTPEGLLIWADKL